jgi:hypothetical protein
MGNFIRSEGMTQPKVAILLENLKVASEMGKVFRKLNIIPDCFDSAESFLIAQIESPYDLCVLDIEKCLYEGKPLVSRRELAGVELSFFYNSETAEMLVHTYGMNHLGYVDKERDLIGQIKNLLVRYNSRSATRSEMSYLKNFHNEYKTRQQKLMANNQAQKEKLYFKEMLFDLVKDIQMNAENGFFSDVMSTILDQKDFVEGYTYLELNETKNKLIPMAMDGTKQIDTPPLWLGQTLVDGIGDHAIAMTQNVLSSLVTNPVVAITLSKDALNTNALLMLEVKDEVLFSLDWEVAEIVINGLYAQTYVKKMERLNTIESRTSFDLMARLNQSTADLHLIGIDLSDILDFQEAKKEARFNWAKFWNDFRVFLSPITESKDIYNVSVDSIVFPVSANIFDEAFAATSDLCQRFSIAKYFHGAQNIDLQNIKLHVREIPCSQYGLVSHIENRNSMAGSGEVTL